MGADHLCEGWDRLVIPGVPAHPHSPGPVHTSEPGSPVTPGPLSALPGLPSKQPCITSPGRPLKDHSKKEKKKAFELNLTPHYSENPTHPPRPPLPRAASWTLPGLSPPCMPQVQRQLRPVLPAGSHPLATGGLTVLQIMTRRGSSFLSFCLCLSLLSLCLSDSLSPPPPPATPPVTTPNSQAQLQEGQS